MRLVVCMESMMDMVDNILHNLRILFCFIDISSENLLRILESQEEYKKDKVFEYNFIYTFLLV